MDAINELEPVDQKRVQKLAALDWLPSGKVLREFVLAPEPVSCIMGPFGSGKTIASFVKGLLCSCVVPKSPADGVRYARGLVVRDTYRNLEMNTIASWHERFPPNLGSWKGGGGGEPAKAIIDFELAPGDILHMEVIFAALGEHNVKTFCDGFQANWCFANGLDALPADFLLFMPPRLGRWPPPQHRPEDWKKHTHRWMKLFADMNAPDIDNWTYGNEEKQEAGFVEHVPDDWKLFIQPGGLDPQAENIENLPDGYYDKLGNNKAKWWVNRFVHNKFGYSRAGSPVYPEWNDAIHVAPSTIAFNRHEKLTIGLDAGRDPRAVAIQRNFMGRVRVLREFVPDERMGAKKFGKALSAWLAEKFPDAEKIEGWSDPAAADPTQDSEDDAVWLDTVKTVAEIPIRPAPTNAIGPRLESVRQPLTELIDGTPAFALDPSCRVLRRGFNSGYRFAKEKHHGEERDADKPNKNAFSHVHDALQYACLGSSDWRELRGREERRAVRHVEETDWNPHQ